MKFIKFLILTLRNIWKYKWGYILLIFEIFLVSILFLSFGSKFQGVYESSAVRNAFNEKNMYYYFQYSYTRRDLCEILSPEVLHEIEIVEIPELLLTDNNKSYLAYGYSDLIINACQYEMSKGIWFDEYTGNHIPVISLTSDIKIGEKIELGEGENRILEVVGYMDDSSYILNFHGGANNNHGSLKHFVSHPSGQLIVPYNSQLYLSVDRKDIDFYDSGNARMVFIENKNVADEFLKQCHDYGAVSSVKVMKENYYIDQKYDFIVNGVVLLVFSALSITGLIGFHGVQNAIHERTYLIYYFLGGDSWYFVLMEVLKNFLVLFISFFCFLILYEKMDIFNYTASQLEVINLKTILAVFFFLSAICIGTSLWYIKKLIKKQWIYAYKLKA